MPDDLKPCPFCGSDKVWLDPLGIRNGEHSDFTPQCNGCGATIIPVVNWTRGQATTAWNTRAPDPVAFAAGAEAMRERAAENVERWHADDARDMAADIRVLPIPPMEPNT